ncbi:MAG: ABC transporter ATP-binding protein [Clostridiales bacterium]|nr:ABC transporter ATP-binding protein [Clostridiales bacterium]
MKNKQLKKKKIGLTQYLAKYKWGIFLYIFVYAIASACSIFMTILAANAIEKISGETPDFKWGMILAAIVLGLTILQRGCWYASGWIYSKYSAKIMSDLNLDLAKQAFKLNSKTYNDHETGTFVQRIVSDPERIVESLANIVDFMTEIISAIIMIIYISTLDPWVALIFVGTIIIGVALEAKRIVVRRKNRKDLRAKNDKINSLTTEIVRSEKDIKSLGLEEKLSEVSKENYNAYRKARIKFDITDMNFWSLRNIIVEIVGALVVIFGIWQMNLGAMTLGTFMIIYSNRGSLRNLIWDVGAVANSFVDIKVCHERMFALFDEKEFVTEKFGKKKLDKIVGEVEFKNVSYTFKEYEFEEISKENLKKKKRERKLVSENQIFKDLSFKIVPNTTVAFVGKSGSGKSTILNLMSKMYDSDGGEVLIDGNDIKSLNKETLRKAISLVNQFPYIFDMTIKENLLLAKSNATDEEINEAIRKASLEDFVSTLPKGIETKVGESGIKLSGGQKQRLAIARALLRNSPIIIFDESTSSLDNFAQEEVKKSIDSLKGQSTIVIVAHRLSTIKNVDKIFFLDNGQIVDDGTFEELFERNQKFKAMFLAENV